jgi:hypothetical protein
LLALVLLPATARGQVAGTAPSPDEWDDSAAPPPPSQPPPSPPPQVQPPPQAQPAPGAPAGQWVDTQQYGRIWMPYSDAYTYIPPGGTGEPCAYVYYPSYGWTWVVAPWIWGWGPWPVFSLGPVYYGWYGHGWWRTPYRWHYAPGYAGGYPHGVRPAPYAARPAPYARPLPSGGFSRPMPAVHAGRAGGWGGRGGRGR